MMAKMTALACLCAGMLFVALTGSADVMSEIRKACFEGADTRIVFRVVDDDGLAVSNATVDVLFGSSGISVGGMLPHKFV